MSSYIGFELNLQNIFIFQRCVFDLMLTDVQMQFIPLRLFSVLGNPFTSYNLMSSVQMLHSLSDKDPVMPKFSYRVLCLLLLVTSLLFLASDRVQPRRPLPCSLSFPLNPGPALPELLPRSGSIWMLESSGRDHLQPLELCSLESAALHNPNSSVHMLLTYPIQEAKGRLLQLMDIYPNIVAQFVDLDTLMLASPLADLWQSGQVHTSPHPVSHLSDLLRYLLLHRWGGVYLDTDVILLKTLPEAKNFTAIEWAPLDRLAAGAMAFTPAHPVITEVLASLAANFSTTWGGNGPLRLDSVLRAKCLQPRENWGKWCGDVAILPQQEFYAINWRHVDRFFHPDAWPEVSTALKGRSGVHLWGKHSRSLMASLKGGRDQPLLKVAIKNCPTAHQWLKTG